MKSIPVPSSMQYKFYKYIDEHIWGSIDRNIFTSLFGKLVLYVLNILKYFRKSKNNKNDITLCFRFHDLCNNVSVNNYLRFFNIK